MQTVLFLVPARGGSKGIPRKNLVPLAGRPLLAYVLAAATDAGVQLEEVATRLVVSTDDDEIARTAERFGAEVPFRRPAELATDASTSIDVVLHALEVLERDEGYVPDAIVLLQPTSPLVLGDDIAGAVRSFFRYRTSVVSLVENEHPPEWMFYLDDDRLKRVLPGPVATRRQDARRAYRLNGAIYVAGVASIRSGNGFIGPDARGFVMSSERSVDIDTYLDLRVAEAVLASERISLTRAT